MNEPVAAATRASFETLLSPHLDSLWRTAYRFTGHREDAEDLLQDLLAHLYPQREKLAQVDSLRPWLLRSLYHLYVDRRRRWLRSVLSRAEEIEPLEEEAIASTEPGPEEDAQAESLRRIVFHALAALDAEQRAVMVLHDMEGHTLAELAATLDTPLGTLKSRLFRARRRLRTLLGGNLLAAAGVLEK